MKKGDLVVIKTDEFNVLRRITRVLKDGRIQIGKGCWDPDALRLPREEEVKAFDLQERADRVTEELRAWESALIEDEVLVLEDVYQKLMRRLLDENTHD